MHTRRIGSNVITNLYPFITMYHAEFHFTSGDDTMTSCRVGFVSANPGSADNLGWSSYQCGWNASGNIEVNGGNGYSPPLGAWDATNVIGISLLQVAGTPTGSKSAQALFWLDGVLKCSMNLSRVNTALANPFKYACSLPTTGTPDRTITFVPAAADWLFPPDGAVEYNASATMTAHSGGSVTGGVTCHQGSQTSNPYWASDFITAQAG